MVVAEKKSKLQGRLVDDLGFWNPHTNKYSLNTEKTNKWLKEGVRPTDTAYNLLVKAGVIKGTKIAVHKKSKKPQEVAAPVSEPVAEVTAANQTEESPSIEEDVPKEIIEEAAVNTIEEKPVSEEAISEPATEENTTDANENQE